jgi:flagellar motor switch protein FliM
MPGPNEPTGGGEVLSQSEVEHLLAQVAAQEQAAATKPEEKDAGAQDGVRPFDFRQPAFLSPADLRRLRLRHEEFIRSLSARLSIYLRLEFGLRLAQLHTVSYRKFTHSLPQPTHLSLFKAEPLRGVGLLEIPRGLAMSIVDRLLGGPAQSSSTDHEFSEIEIALLDQVVQVVLAEWCNLWSGFRELRPALLGHEDNGKFLQTAPHDTVMLVLVMETKIGECAGQMQLAVPCSTLEPFVRQMGQPPEPPLTDARLAVASCKWNRNFDDVPVPVTAIWNDVQLTARALAQLKPGDVLPLHAECTRRVKLRLADLPKFEGHLGTTNGKWAVAVTGVVKTSIDN